jgi:hypothetical protein
LESRTVTAGGKAFLFLSKKDVRLKLHESIGEATRLAAAQPGRYQVGAHGWIKITLTDEAAGPLDLLEQWIGESYRQFAPKKPAAAEKPQRHASGGKAIKASNKRKPEKRSTSKGKAQ